MRVIGTAAEVEALARELRGWARVRGPFELRLAALDDDGNRRLGAAMNEHAGACGCASGGLLMSMGVVVMIVAYFVGGGRLVDVGRRELLALVGWTAALAVIGKLLGLGWARWRLLSLVRLVAGLAGGHTATATATGTAPSTARARSTAHR